MRFKRRSAICAVLALFCYSAVCGAQNLIVGSGASFSMGSSIVDMGCRDLQLMGSLDVGAGTLQNVRDATASGGTLRGGSGVLSLSGDLSLGSALQAQNGTVRIVDGCGRSQSRVDGDHAFHRFAVVTDSSYRLLLPGGGTQTIGNALELSGGTERLELRSSVVGLVSFLALDDSGTQLISRIDAQDVGAPPAAQYLARDIPEFFDSIDRGNTPRLFVGIDEPPIPVPALAPYSLLLMLLSIVALAAVRLRTPAR